MRLILIMGALLLFGGMQAQNEVLLDDNYPFKEGVYLTIDDFINNKVVEPAKITAIHSGKATKNFDNGRKDRARGLSWDFYAELVYSTKSSITVDSLNVLLGESRFETLIPGHNFFGLSINGRLYLNISPYQRPSGGHDPIFGRAVFIGGLTVLYIDYEFDGNADYYVREGDATVVKEGGLQETIRSIVIFDILSHQFYFADEKSFAIKIEDDEEILNKYLADRKRKKRIPYYADLYNKKHPVYLR